MTEVSRFALISDTDRMRDAYAVAHPERRSGRSHKHTVIPINLTVPNAWGLVFTSEHLQVQLYPVSDIRTDTPQSR